MRRIYRIRIVVTLLVVLFIIAFPMSQAPLPSVGPDKQLSASSKPMLEILESLPVKGRAPKTGYTRTQFGDGWANIGGCDMRNIILHRDLTDPIVDEKCHVIRGTLHDPYTGKTIQFQRGETSSADVQIDHVVALSNAWQTGAQQLTYLQREALANDPLELLAVDGPANQQKGDGDAATWLPKNKAFRCQYVERQIKVKQKYHLWVTPSEKEVIKQVIAQC